MPRRQSNGSPDLRPLVLHYVRSKGGDVTIGTLLADPVIGALVPSLTLAELMGGEIPTPRGGTLRGRKPGAGPKSADGSRGAVDVSSAAGRSMYDEQVLAAIRGAGGAASAESLLPKAGGDPAQFRASTKRLLAARKIRRSGKARGTKYAAA